MSTSLLARSGLFWILLLAGLFLFVLVLTPGPLVEVLWMQSLGYEAVLWKVIGTKALLFAVAFAAAAACLGVHAFVLLRNFPVLQWLNAGARRGPAQLRELVVTPRLLRVMSTATALFIGLLFGLRFASAWDAYLRFRGAAPVGTPDPLFGADLSFYLLRLPFVELVQDALSVLAVLGLGLAVGGYVVLGNVTVAHGRIQAPRRVALHLAVAVVCVLAAWAWGFYLDRYALLLGHHGVVHGARYIDVHVVLPVLWVMVAASVALMALVLQGAMAGRLRPFLIGLGVYAAVFVVGRVVVPSMVQSFHVEPNEPQLEAPYIGHNIALTRAAYGLDRVREEDYPALPALRPEQVAPNAATLRNVRLWDPRLLIQNFRQLQEIRPYYQFYDVDVDRYRLDSVYTQVMVSARELEQQLPERADTWVNRHLQYTHGYGVAMAQVARQGVEGSPALVVRDLPPVVSGGLTLTQPAIYFGENTPGYRIVNSRVEELDYPRGDDNAYTRYAGTGGVLLSAAWRRLLYAWYLGDFSIFLSDYITGESRVQYWNRLQERIHRVAPFLQLDPDPYLVLSDGRLYWIQDAYTTARTHPYAEPIAGGVNYIRNAVKVVVDAYEGSVDLYVSDPADPVAAAYGRAFPGLFKDLSAMPAGLRAHLRYPEGLFQIQVEKYNRYHMTTPQVFYSNEDLWAIPQEKYGGEVVPMEPYYIMMPLPGEDELEFMLMQPVTPANRPNMIAWIAARCDGPNYGELVVYKLPKERLIYGPNQIESRIDQDTEISQQLALWDQRGSRVIRGNLIVVPVAGAFLFVEPVFLIAQGNQIPELQRVIVATGERVAMATTLDGALAAVLEGALPTPAPPSPGAPPPPTPAPADASPQLDRARETLDRALEALRAGDFGTFGDELEALRRILHETNPPPPN